LVKPIEGDERKQNTKHTHRETDRIRKRLETREKKVKKAKDEKVCLLLEEVVAVAAVGMDGEVKEEEGKKEVVVGI
jgi:hypothetical protein